MTRPPANSHRSLTSMDTYIQNGEGRRFKLFREFQAQGLEAIAKQRLPLLTRPRFPSGDYIPITASPIPPRKGLQFSSVLGSKTASPASATGPPISPGLPARCLSDRDQSLELIPSLRWSHCNIHKTRVQFPAQSAPPALLRDTSVPSRLGPAECWVGRRK